MSLEQLPLVDEPLDEIVEAKVREDEGLLDA